jgi:hypothetical protein
MREVGHTPRHGCACWPGFSFVAKAEYFRFQQTGQALYLWADYFRFQQAGQAQYFWKMLTIFDFSRLARLNTRSKG